jgi:hypothetical protein
MDQLAALLSTLDAYGVEYFASLMFWLNTKLATSTPNVFMNRTVPFRFNRLQKHLYGNIAQNNRVLKQRQGGLTTFMLLIRLLLPIITEPGKTGLLISQNSRYAAMHFAIARRAYRLIGAVDPLNDEVNSLSLSLKQNLLHTRYSNRRELDLDVIDSKLIVESAEVEEAGQGVTTHHVVSSETSRWPGDPEATTSNIKGSLVPGGTYDEECTANGAMGYFYTQYLKAMQDPKNADARCHFYEWWWSSEYEIKLSPKQAKELEDDLTADELRIIAKMHSQLGVVAWPKKAA